MKTRLHYLLGLEKAKKCLRNIIHIFFDGTFFNVPVQATQLFNILGLIGNGETERAIPLLHAFNDSYDRTSLQRSVQ